MLKRFCNRLSQHTMKKITALILLFAYLGYISGIIQNGYHAKEHGQCPDLYNYVKNSVKETESNFYVETCTSHFLSTHFHMASAGEVKFLRLQACLSLLFNALTRPAECTGNNALFNTAKQAEYTTRVFLKNRVLRL